MNERIIAVLLSFAFPDLGQLYNRQPAKGLWFLVSQSPAMLLAGFTDVPLSMVLLVCGVPGVWAAWDAYTVAGRRAFYRAFE